MADGSRPFVAWLLAVAVRLLALTWRVGRVPPRLLEETLGEGPVVFAFLHGDQLPLVALHRGRPITGMASLSRDGALLAGVVQRLGYRVVRGSSSRGGAAAGLGALRELRHGRSPALAVDGPRGPRGVPHPGAGLLAAAAGRPVVLVVVRARPCLRLRTWDRFRIPWPFASVELHYARMEPPARDRSDLEPWNEELAATLARLGAARAPVEGAPPATRARRA